ncbi:MAG: TIGR03905 family TSCPD domain-containing protein [Bacillales bacterium]|jgi:uncharacterized protein (TIGR03905 family)|nr:TIGR03905 family TSCPD domain-containing protein [Bacillales bacterium]
MEYKKELSGVCAKTVKFKIENERVYDVSFEGGCNGNLKAISKLINGLKASEIIEKLEGNTCGFRNTSCADQLSKALKSVL